MLAPAPSNLSPEAMKAYGAYLAATAYDSFYAYRQLANPSFTWGWFTQDLATHLYEFYQDLVAGKRPILCIHTPPQHSKSMTVLDFAAWLAGRRPQTQIVYAAFSERLGTRANLRIQRSLERDLYRMAFPNTRLNPPGEPGALRNHEVLEFLDSGGGLWRNTTVKGSINGEGFDLMIVDDPMKGRAEAHSQIERDRVWLWFTDDLLPRQSEYAGLLFIGTRWHLDDPAGRLHERFGKRVKILRYPAIAEQDELHRRMGAPLFPGLKSAEFLAERRATLTQASWQALYQQTPIVAGGGMFPLDKIDIIPASPATSEVVSAARYWDKAGTADGGAYSAGVLMLRMREGNYVVVDVRRGQWSALDRERMIKQTAQVDHDLYPTTKIYVEQEPGSGGKESAESSVRSLAGFSVYADKVSGKKEVRADPFAAQWQAGNVRLVSGDWNRAYLDEHEHFPSGKYKDQVDASAGAFNKIVSKYRYDSTLSWVS